jgi:hypothetical protein
MVKNQVDIWMETILSKLIILSQSDESKIFNQISLSSTEEVGEASWVATSHHIDQVLTRGLNGGGAAHPNTFFFPIKGLNCEASLIVCWSSLWWSLKREDQQLIQVD